MNESLPMQEMGSAVAAHIRDVQVDRVDALAAANVGPTCAYVRGDAEHSRCDQPYEFDVRYWNTDAATRRGRLRVCGKHVGRLIERLAVTFKATRIVVQPTEATRADAT